MNIDTFKVHSIRGAASSSAAWPEVTIPDILNGLQRLHFDSSIIGRYQTDQLFGSAVLSSVSTSSLHVHMKTELPEM